MSTTVTKIETPRHRKIIVTRYSDGVTYLDVNDTCSSPDDGARVFSLLKKNEAKQIATALLGDNVTIITDLPKAELDGYGYVQSGNYSKHKSMDPTVIENGAKKLLAIAAFIRKANAEKAEAEAAALAKHEEILKLEQAERESLKARRDALVQEFTGNPLTAYAFTSQLSRNAVDRVIELEDKAAKKHPTTSMFSL